MRYAVCALVTKLMLDKELVLCVSRKDDHEDFGLPGGMSEEGENYIDAVTRELEEETGLKLHPAYPAKPIFVGEEGGNLVTTFLCIPPSGQTIQSKETGIIKWMTWDELCSQGSFKEYNIKVRKQYEELNKNLLKSPT